MYVGRKNGFIHVLCNVGTGRRICGCTVRADAGEMFLKKNKPPRRDDRAGETTTYVSALFDVVMNTYSRLRRFVDVDGYLRRVNTHAHRYASLVVIPYIYIYIHTLVDMYRVRCTHNTFMAFIWTR